MTNTSKYLFKSRCSYCNVVAWIFIFFVQQQTVLKCISRKGKQADFVLLRLSLSTNCLEPHFTNVFVATNDNRRKLGCMAATGLFHSVMRFHWHPSQCVVVFSSHCNSDSKMVWLIVHWSFHVLHKAGKVGQGNGCFALWTQERNSPKTQDWW